MRILPALLMLLALALPASQTVLAQTAPQTSPQAAAPPPAANALPAAEAQRLLGLLRDDARRAELLRTLEALAAAERAAARPPQGGTTGQGGATAQGSAQGAAAPTGGQSGGQGSGQGAAAGATPPAPAPAPAPAAAVEQLLAPNTLGGQILIGASQRLSWLSEQIVRAAEAITDLPSLVAWFSSSVRDPVTQKRVTDASWKLALLLGLGVLAEWAVWRALEGPRRRLDAAAPTAPLQGWARLRRVPLVLGRLVLDLLPIAAFAVLSYGLIGAVRPLPTTQLVLLTANNAYIACRMLMALARMLFSPASAHLRVLPCGDLTAAYVTIWLRRLVVVLITGWAVAEAGLLFGLPWGAYDAILRLVLLVASVFLGIIVLQNRVAVASVLRAPPLKPGDSPNASRRALRRLRDWLAEVWHILAILYLLALWGVWALEVRDGFSRLLRASVLTLVVLATAKALDMLLRRALSGSFRISMDLAGRYPALEARANRYVPMLKSIVSAVLTVLTVLTLLEVWGIRSFAWFAPGSLGSQLLHSLLSVGFTAAIAALVWETVNAAIQRHLDRLSRDAQAARSARVRTLVPMLRTTLLIVILLFVAFNLLTELGVNVAPLLAGAGVIGLALGFGSQKLVQDVITGVFLLFEDAMAVGDVVNLGGKSGVVEKLSIRSITLRDTDGSIHIIPFSTVSAVTNMTRDFSFAVLDVQVSYREDTDRVVEVLSGICREMRSEAKWGLAIRDELEVLGVNQLTPDGPILRVRVKTEPIQRWSVLREMNRRINQRFSELGIEIPASRQTLILEGQASQAQPATSQPASPGAGSGAGSGAGPATANG
ncbi:mechanosensitive ion channel [Roseomonas sp. GC11]|uniref:mechanosensitive ion channel domain-containing protein n=1 Tax=Roseomonas sp. GC11 TaxID=2950546 RepID=UPI00210DA25A|nr:mechanosensitive ion channel domain-containing protein [Roseomonas sp. GC11]MCQ4161434.1 mechanosensitive ion channel [Roseomonas sp. GC11]